MNGNIIILHASTIGRLSTPVFVKEDGVRDGLSVGASTDEKVDEVTGRMAAEAIARFHPTKEARMQAGAGYLSHLFEPIQWSDELNRKLNMRKAFVARLERA